jgi:hypothetical protein
LDVGTDQELTLASDQLYGESHKGAWFSVLFDQDSDRIEDYRKDAIRSFAMKFNARSAVGGLPVDVTGRASAEGTEEHNRRLSLRRANAVADVLRGPDGLALADIRIVSIVGTGEEGTTEDPEWRRVDIFVGADQATAAHEFGHMIGLGDEYPTEEAPPGTPSAHDTPRRSLTRPARRARTRPA